MMEKMKLVIMASLLVASSDGGTFSRVGVTICIEKMIKEKKMSAPQIMEYISERYVSSRGSVRFQNECSKLSQVFGGSGGTEFDQGCDRAAMSKIEIYKKQSVKKTPTISGIRTTFSDDSAIMQGEKSDEVSTIDLEPGEKVVGVVGYTGENLDSIGFISEKPSGEMKIHSQFGGEGGNNVFIVLKCVTSFHGRASDNAIDAIGFNIME